MPYRIVAIAFSLLLSNVAAAHAQTELSVVGTVTDETKSVLPGVTITATDLATGRQFVGVTDTRGDYRLASMTASRYRIHKVDLRVSKEVKLAGSMKVMGIGEVFNLFNHANFGNYQALVNTSTFGNPLQNSANTYLPRSAQFAFKITF